MVGCGFGTLQNTPYYEVNEIMSLYFRGIRWYSQTTFGNNRATWKTQFMPSKTKGVLQRSYSVRYNKLYAGYDAIMLMELDIPHGVSQYKTETLNTGLRFREALESCAANEILITMAL